MPSIEKLHPMLHLCYILSMVNHFLNCVHVLGSLPTIMETIKRTVHMIVHASIVIAQNFYLNDK